MKGVFYGLICVCVCGGGGGGLSAEGLYVVSILRQEKGGLICGGGGGGRRGGELICGVLRYFNIILKK